MPRLLSLFAAIVIAVTHTGCIFIARYDSGWVEPDSVKVDSPANVRAYVEAGVYQQMIEITNDITPIERITGSPGQSESFRAATLSILREANVFSEVHTNATAARDLKVEFALVNEFAKRRQSNKALILVLCQFTLATIPVWYSDHHYLRVTATDTTGTEVYQRVYRGRVTTAVWLPFLPVGLFTIGAWDRSVKNLCRTATLELYAFLQAEPTP